MTFDEFRKQLRIKNSITGITTIKNHKEHYASVYNMHKIMGNISDIRQTGKSTHNTLLSIYNFVHKSQTSLIVVQNKQDYLRQIRDLESFTVQLSLSNPIVFSHDFKHEYISILSLNDWKKSPTTLNKSYDNIFIDNTIIEKYNLCLSEAAPGSEFFIKLCHNFNYALLHSQRQHKIKSVNGIVKINDKKIITADDSHFNEGDLFAISIKPPRSSNIGVLVSIGDHDKIPRWFASIETLINETIVKMSALDVEFFTKL